MYSKSYLNHSKILTFLIKGIMQGFYGREFLLKLKHMIQSYNKYGKSLQICGKGTMALFIIVLIQNNGLLLYREQFQHYKVFELYNPFFFSLLLNFYKRFLSSKSTSIDM